MFSILIIIATQDQVLILDEEFKFQHKLLLENKSSSSELLSTMQTQTFLPISCSCISKIDNRNFV